MIMNYVSGTLVGRGEETDSLEKRGFVDANRPRSRNRGSGNAGGCNANGNCNGELGIRVWGRYLGMPLYL